MEQQKCMSEKFDSPKWDHTPRRCMVNAHFLLTHQDTETHQPYLILLCTNCAADAITEPEPFSRTLSLTAIV